MNERRKRERKKWKRRNNGTKDGIRRTEERKKGRMEERRKGMSEGIDGRKEARRQRRKWNERKIGRKETKEMKDRRK